MNKLFHVIIALAWFYTLMSMIGIFESGDYDIFDFIITFYAIGCAITQIFYLLADAYNNLFSE